MDQKQWMTHVENLASSLDLADQTAAKIMLVLLVLGTWEDAGVTDTQSLSIATAFGVNPSTAKRALGRLTELGLRE